MSPEQIEGKELDGRSDIFSLGAVLYEMLTAGERFRGRVNSVSLRPSRKRTGSHQHNPAADAAGARPRHPPLPCERSRRPLANGARSAARVEVDRRGRLAGRFDSAGRGKTYRARWQELCCGARIVAPCRRHRLAIWSLKALAATAHNARVITLPLGQRLAALDQPACGSFTRRHSSCVRGHARRRTADLSAGDG